MQYAFKEIHYAVKGAACHWQDAGCVETIVLFNHYFPSNYYAQLYAFRNLEHIILSPENIASP